MSKPKKYFFEHIQLYLQIYTIIQETTHTHEGHEG